MNAYCTKDVKSSSEQGGHIGGLIDMGNIYQYMYTCLKIVLCNCMLKETYVLEQSLLSEVRQ